MDGMDVDARLAGGINPNIALCPVSWCTEARICSVSLHRPDKVQHLGPELKDLAERKTKELNEAYDWLKEKYAI